MKLVPAIRGILPLAGATVLAGLLLRRIGIWGGGRPLPVLGRDGRPRPGSRSEKIHVGVNGVRQGMFIQSVDDAHPVLLYLHGGLPEYFLTERFPTGLEEDFTVVWWEQRGIGLSSRDVPPETVTVEQCVADTLAVTDYLRRRFDQDRIYLMAHSGGTFIGLRAAARSPESYWAYIGQAQMVNQLESERLAYVYMLERFRQNGNAGMLRRLEAAPVTAAEGVPDDYLRVRDKAMHSLGIGTMHDMRSVLTGIVWPSLRSPQYTLREKAATWRTKLSTGVSVLWEEMVTTDLSQEVARLDVPLYLLHGVHDYTCSYPLAREFFQRVEAPVKGFYTFDRSAHSPIFEEPRRVRRIMREDVLAGRNDLADAR